jgi:hypothetical protein
MLIPQHIYNYVYMPPPPIFSFLLTRHPFPRIILRRCFLSTYTSNVARVSYSILIVRVIFFFFLYSYLCFVLANKLKYMNVSSLSWVSKCELSSYFNSFVSKADLRPISIYILQSKDEPKWGPSVATLHDKTD